MGDWPQNLVDSALLAGTLYDPAVAVAKTVNSLKAMTAFDTTNLRLSFTAPANGAVRVHSRVQQVGGFPGIVLLGVLDGATVRARQAPRGVFSQGAVGGVAVFVDHESSVVVTGLTPGQRYTWDAAYGIEVTSTTNLKYGGPDDTTTTNAWGGFAYEIWEARNLLNAAFYDPAVAVTKATTAVTAMTAFDTTNLRLSFTAPASGTVRVAIQATDTGNSAATNFPNIFFGVLDGATVRGRIAASGHIYADATAASTNMSLRGEFVVSGLTPGTVYTWDAAYGVETASGAGGMKYGGPDNATTNDAWGGLAYEIWAV